MMTTETMSETDLATPTAPQTTDLIAGLRAGDEAAYEELVRQHAGAMLAVARRLLRNDEDAREAVQDAFLQAFRGVDAFREEARLSTWLHRIVVNTALMRLRAASRRPEVPSGDLLPVFDGDGQHAEPLSALPVGPADALEREETRALVRACIAELPAAYRAVIVLRDLEELSTEEAAAALGVSANAVKIRLHRARQALLKLLERAGVRS
jgi:RNA polymerase sigma-70 factor (ECF subfamily)